MLDDAKLRTRLVALDSPRHRVDRRRNHVDAPPGHMK
jgi:hypothetical protein